LGQRRFQCGEYRQAYAGRPTVRRYDAARAARPLVFASIGGIRPPPCHTREEGRPMKRKHLSLAIGCVLLSSMPVAWAQDAAPADAPPAATATTLDSIKVTARKREETLQEVPVAVTAFTSESLDKLNVRDLG